MALWYEAHVKSTMSLNGLLPGLEDSLVYDRTDVQACANEAIWTIAADTVGLVTGLVA